VTVEDGPEGVGDTGDWDADILQVATSEARIAQLSAPTSWLAKRAFFPVTSVKLV